MVALLPPRSYEGTWLQVCEECLKTDFPEKYAFNSNARPRTLPHSPVLQIGKWGTPTQIHKSVVVSVAVLVVYNGRFRIV